MGKKKKKRAILVSEQKKGTEKLMAIWGQRPPIMSQGIFTKVSKTPVPDQRTRDSSGEWWVTFCWHFPAALDAWLSQDGVRNIYGYAQCDTDVKGCRFFQGTASALGPVMRSLDPGRLNGNHWSTDNRWLKALSTPLLDFNIREALELGFLSGAVCQTKESWAWKMGSNSGTRPCRLAQG